MSEVYDPAGRTTAVRAVKGTATLQSLSYAYTRGTKETDLRSTATDNQAGNTTSYSYDTLNRLTGASTGGGDTYSYTYDANGNRLTQSKNETTTSYSYNSANQLTQAGTTTMSYDLAGNWTGSSLGFSGSYNARGSIGVPDDASQWVSVATLAVL
jgi:YD repeat-containing protein